MDEIELIKELSELPGISSRENCVADRFIQLLPEFVVVSRDNLGSVIAKKEGDSNDLKIMISAHLDEVGFMVTAITEKGFINFQTVGGWTSQVLPSQRVVIETSKGNVEGVIGSKYKHIMSKEEMNNIFDVSKLFIDIGVSSKEEATKLGVHPGDSITPCSTFDILNNGSYMIGKALDNRLGCAAIIKIIEKLKLRNHPNELHAIATVQEEVGRKGAITASQTVNPDIAFILDTGVTGDIPYADNDITQCKCGGGPQIFLYDSKLLPHRNLVKYVESVAVKFNIPIQYEFMKNGTTDGSHVQINGSGVPTVVIGFPTRYMHTHNTIAHIEDFRQVVNLLVELICSLSLDVRNNILGY